jgi:DNA polymerase
MEPFGNFKKKILNIGEAPGETEDDLGKPWQGKAGKLLHRAYQKLGIDLFEDCLNVNACLCRPTDEGGNNRAPENFEMECCRPSILKLIEQKKPKIIILLGNSPVYSLIGHRWKRDLGGISKWRGFTIPDQDFNAWICPTFHPSYIERSEGVVEQVIWMEDLSQAFSLLKIPVPIYFEPDIEEIEDLSVLDTIKYATVAFDYETTGIKPHAPGHRIVSVSIANTRDHAYTFLMPDTREKRLPFIRLLANEEIRKCAHNIKFEETWSVVKLRQPVQGWYADTMQLAHILDNRPGITSLKFQTYVNFGIVDYEEDVAPYLQSIEPNNANSLNRIFELLSKPGGKQKRLKYNGLDSINEIRLLEKFEEHILPF